MKYILQCLSLSVLSIYLLNGCIDDKSEGAYIPLSEINFEVGQDSFYTDYGSQTVIPAPKITQTMGEKELTYEWRASLQKGSNEDSLKYISYDPELQYTFRELGEYRVRLRVSNGDVSKMYNYRVFVRTAFIEGLFVLSADEQGKGRTSFLRTSQESDVWQGVESEFKTHAVEAVNPEIVLDDPTDATSGNMRGGSVLYLTCRKSQKIYQFDNKTFDLLYIFDVKQELPRIKPVAVVTGFKGPYPGDPATLYVMPDRGNAAGLNPLNYFLYEDSQIFPAEAVYDKWAIALPPGNLHAFLYFMDNRRERMDCIFSMFFGMMTFTSNSRDIFKGYHVLNLTGRTSEERGGMSELWTVATDKTNVSRVRITKFMESGMSFTAFDDPKEKSYEISDPLTLTGQSTMVMAHNNLGVCFYNNGSKLYRWKYVEGNAEVQPLPVEADAVLSVEGEITSLEASTNRLYLYIGVWNPRAIGELKGSVLVYDIVNQKVVKSYPNVADRPVKVFYKSAG
ncbi:PKD-like family lipoprotein [Sanguibacteroides justesenii]|uniref:PKD domain-containing protein n=1 Tax=Sanguibacteroides justesenii TaxID=1547597 RepID=A0AB34R355_9PORP|nr:PKD-like family lipoprotein [Sanguibacteroides justesenii]KIO43743.1 hypothetical protein IE90_11565 [Sanguibacteroides justesenii]